MFLLIKLILLHLWKLWFAQMKNVLDLLHLLFNDCFYFIWIYIYMREVFVQTKVRNIINGSKNGKLIALNDITN